MNHNIFYVGLDLGSNTCYQVVMEAGGTIVRSRSFATSEQNLRSAFSGFEGETRVHMEAGELANWVCVVLAPLVGRVIVSHPRTLAWIAKDPRKSDKVDARKLAELLRLNLTQEVFVPTDGRRRTFKQLVRHFDDASRRQARLKAKLKARFRRQGIIERGSQVFEKTGRELVLAKFRMNSYADNQRFDDRCQCAVT